MKYSKHGRSKMKTITKLLLTAGLLLTGAAYAEMPAYLKGATVTVTIANGETHSFKSEEFKVVPRIAVKAPVSPVVKRTRLLLAVGGGPDGLSTKAVGSSTQVEMRNKAVWGVGLQQEIGNGYSLGVLGVSNGTVLGTVGKDF